MVEKTGVFRLSLLWYPLLMPEILEKLTVLAPAKINLHLAVKTKRSDGFHDIESIFLAVDLYDTLHFQLINDDNFLEITMKNRDKLTTVSEFDSIPMFNNIIFRAITLFREKTGYSQGIRVKVEKCIPPGGGLGGGSSDAAATLLTLNKIAGFPCCQETLLKMAASLGSDVPFFIHKTSVAWVTGRGENIQPIEAPPMFLVLVNPGFPSNTASAFRLLDEYRNRNSSRTDVEPSVRKTMRTQSGDSIPFVINEKSMNNTYISYLNNKKSDKNSAFFAPWRLGENKFANDFLNVFPKRERIIYSDIISQLTELGAEYANLSGAGSTCFGVFNSNEQTQKAVEFLHGKWPFIQECTSINKINHYL